MGRPLLRVLAFIRVMKIIIYMTVSTNEVNNVVSLIRQVDENSFINVTDLRQVFGKFYISPIK